MPRRSILIAIIRTDLLVLAVFCAADAFAQTPPQTAPAAPQSMAQPAAAMQPPTALQTPSQAAALVNAPQAIPANSPATPSLMPLPDLELLKLRLEQQDEELRQLRERISSMQTVPQPLPAVTATDPQSPTAGLLQTSADLPAPLGAPGAFNPASGAIPTTASMNNSAMNNSSVADLQDRMTVLEKRLADTTAAQQKQLDDATKGYEVGSDLKMSGSWAKGVQLQSANKDFRLHIGGVLQFDSNFFDNPAGIQAAPAVGGIGPQPDSLDFRRIRLRMDGTFYEVFDFFVQVDFANTVTPAGSPSVQAPATTNPAFDEMYINWGQLPVVGNFRAGNIKEPLGFEHMQTDSQLPFMERSYLQDFVFGPFNGGYSPGFEFLNWRQDQTATWAVGFFGADSDQFGYSLGNDYAFTTRETWCPIYDEPSDGAYMLHFGAAGSIRSSDEGVIRIRDRGDIRSGPPGILNPIYADTNYSGTIHAPQQNIAAAECACVIGSFSTVAEYAGTWIEDATIGAVNHGTPFFQGGYVQCGYMLTGEHEVYDRHRATFERIVPYENAFFVRNDRGGICNGWGAWQVLVRYNTLDLDDNGINGGTLNSFTLGVNWFWNPQARMQLNYDFTNRSSVKSVAQADLNALGVRFSYDF